MTLRTSETGDAEEFDLATARALQRAGQDLQQLIVRIARRHVDRHKATRRNHGHEVAWCWRELLEIEDQTFGDLGFQGGHSPEILASSTGCATAVCYRPIWTHRSTGIVTMTKCLP